MRMIGQLMVFYGQNTYDIYVLEYLCRIHIETYGRYIYIYGYILCMIHTEDVHEGSMIFELGEVR